ncbi:MAG: hypothetical protein COB09_18430 [Thalassobium sp.]|nr:MAG: hypothetical protein COB09_18430 [Thalassobium sp.]
MCPPAIGSTWVHSNKNVYEVMLITNQESTNPMYMPTVVYMNADTGSTWTRPLHDWYRSMTLCDFKYKKEEF